MKTTILTLLLIIPTLVRSQINSNIITQQEFNNITINNVTFSNIKATNGNQNLLDNLFSYDIIENDIITEENYYNYIFDGFDICFSNNEISRLEIRNNNWSVNIQGHTVSISSHKVDLGNVVLNNQVCGGKSVVYQYCDGCNNFLSFDLDENNIIIKIIYMEMT